MPGPPMQNCRTRGGRGTGAGVSRVARGKVLPSPARSHRLWEVAEPPARFGSALQLGPRVLDSGVLGIDSRVQQQHAL